MKPVLIRQPALRGGLTASLGLLGAGTMISAAAETPPDMPDIAGRTGRSSHEAELTKYAQKMEFFPSKPLKAPVDVAASSQHPQGSSLCSGLQSEREHFCKDLMRMLGTKATFLYKDGLCMSTANRSPGNLCFDKSLILHGPYSNHLTNLQQL